MKSMLTAVSLVAFAFLSGCGGANRTEAQYADDTKKAFAEPEAEMKACYDGVVAKKPDAKGDVTITFTWSPIVGSDMRYPSVGYAAAVGGDGKEIVGKVNVANSTAPEEVVKCVTDAMAKARLKPSGGNNGDATWTFHFAPGAAPAKTEGNAPHS